MTPPTRSSPGAQATGPLRPGDVLAERYRLVEEVGGIDDTTLWRAVDDVLARTVAVKARAAVGPVGRAAAQPFLDAAVRTGALAHPGLVRVYDAAHETRPGPVDGVAYVVSEWVDGEPLAQTLRDGPLDAVQATTLLRQAADAVTAAHATGTAHGRLHPGNVLLTPAGRLRVTDTAVAAAVHGREGSLEATPEAVQDDTRDLAAVLYCLLTGRWPAGSTPQPGSGVPDAPGARPCSPRQVRAGVPRALDLVVSRALTLGRHPGPPGPATPAALAEAAEAAATQARETQRRQQAGPRPPSRLRRTLPWLVAVGVVGAVGTAGWLLGLAVGDLPRRDGAVEAVVSTTSSAAPSPGASPAAAPVDLTSTPLRDYDPPPGDGQENPDKVRNAVDRDLSTAWSTSLYRTSAFGGLKPGVGLLVDLGSARSLHQVDVALTAAGAGIELRVGDSPDGPLSAYRVVARQGDTGRLSSLRPGDGDRGRYWLVWLTALPSDGGGFREGISELRFS